MLSRTTACRGAQRAARQLSSTQKRGLAAPASGSFQYQSGEAKGVKFASRDFAGPTTTLALVAKAGTRYQSLPGLTEGLANFAFRVCTAPHLAPLHRSPPSHVSARGSSTDAQLHHSPPSEGRPCALSASRSFWELS